VAEPRTRSQLRQYAKDAAHDSGVAEGVYYAGP
jgi:hypothetical protein